MAQPLNRYKADLRDFRFLLFEQLGLQNVLGKGPFAEWGVDECNMVIDEVYRFACEVTGPYNQIGDVEGCKIVDGRVKTPTGFKQAWDKLWEAGWRTLASSEDMNGQGAPMTLAGIVEEMITGSNPAFGMYPGLAMGAAEVISRFGTDRQRKLYVDKMSNGTFGGTMCLTEPHAGSDVGASSTAATRNEDGTYNIKGTKIFISGGDSDLTDNTVHLVLARLEDAEPGTKGLSLFVVPRLRVGEDGSLGDENDVQVVSLEHKMGINGSATCVMQFGDDGNCVGELVGTVEHQGMRTVGQMFVMMNGARILVGVQGLAVASTAYLNALEYAKDRKQGSSIKAFKDAHAERVAIVVHPNIRRDLLDMKSKIEGIRALAMKLTLHQDHIKLIDGKDDESHAYHKGQIDLLVPLLKSYASDMAFRVCETAIQIYGGAGFLTDHPVEQACRDSKIFSIYEGTNFIQSMDLVGRKIGQGGGANTKAFMADIQKFIDENKDHPELGESMGYLQQAQQSVGAAAMKFLGWFKGGQMERVPLASEDFLNMMSELAMGWLLLDGAVVALKKLPEVSETHPDRAFYLGKKYSAIYFANKVLRAIPGQAAAIDHIDDSPIEIPLEAFATV